MASTVLGTLLEGPIDGATYWGENIRRPVLFTAAVETLLDQGHRHFVEIAPHPVLSADITQIMEAKSGPGLVCPSLRRKAPEQLCFRRTLGRLYGQGFPINFAALYPEGNLASLPSYPWQRTRFWMNTATSQRRNRTGHLWVDKPLRPATQPDLEIYRSEFALSEFPFLREHRVGEDVVFPATGFIEVAHEAALRAFGQGPLMLEDLKLEKMLVLSADVQLQLVVEHQDNRLVCRFMAPQTDGEQSWTSFATAVIRRPDTATPSAWQTPKELPLLLEGSAFYAALEQQNMFYGEPFRRVQELRGDGLHLHAVLEGPEDSDTFHFHPTLLDAALHTILGSLERETTDSFLPVGIKRLTLHARPQANGVYHSHVRLDEQENAATLSGDLHLYDDNGQLCATVEGFRLARSRTRRPNPLLRRFLEPVWETKASAVSPASREALQLLVFAGAGQERLPAEIEAQGHRLLVVEPGKAYTRTSDDRFAIDPQNPEHYHTLLKDIAAASPEWDSLIYLWAENTGETVDSEHVNAARCWTSTAPTFLLQALEQSASLSLDELVLVTRNLHGLDRQPGNPLQAPLWGLGRVVNYEQARPRVRRY